MELKSQDKIIFILAEDILWKDIWGLEPLPRPTKIDEKPETPGTRQRTFGRLENMVEENFISTKN